MTCRARVLAALPAAALAAALLTGCGGGTHTPAAAPSSGSTSPAPSASELAHMQKLVDEADSAAAAADSDAASDN